jgi:hypothetical protein
VTRLEIDENFESRVHLYTYLDGEIDEVATGGENYVSLSNDSVFVTNNLY